MRKLTFTILAAAVILLVNSTGWTANAATATRAHSECGEKLLADQGNGVPRLQPLMRPGYLRPAVPAGAGGGPVFKFFRFVCEKRLPDTGCLFRYFEAILPFRGLSSPRNSTAGRHRRCF